MNEGILELLLPAGAAVTPDLIIASIFNSKFNAHISGTYLLPNACGDWFGYLTITKRGEHKERDAPEESIEGIVHLPFLSNDAFLPIVGYRRGSALDCIVETESLRDDSLGDCLLVFKKKGEKEGESEWSGNYAYGGLKPTMTATLKKFF